MSVPTMNGRPTDEQVLDLIRAIRDELGIWPSRNEVAKRAHIGKERAATLLRAVESRSTGAESTVEAGAESTPAAGVESRSTGAESTVEAGAESTPAAGVESRSTGAESTVEAGKVPASTRLFYAGSVLAVGISADTSWRFFGEVLGITSLVERVFFFAILEVSLLACGVAMHEGIQRHGKPGPARWLAWGLCAFAGYMALLLSGPAAGLARVIAGPIMAVVLFHHALGIQLRQRGNRSGLAARVAGELRQRFASRLGLDDEQRTAAVRTAQRAARRAARLATGKRVAFRDARMRRAFRLAGVAHDDDMRARMLRERAHLDATRTFRDLECESPW